MMQTKVAQDEKVKTMVITAIFAAITFLGIQAFRIPLPAAVGTPFVHFGHIFVVMGVLLQGGRRGAVSGTIGLVLFDILNGYMQDVPQVFLDRLGTVLLPDELGPVFLHLRKRKPQIFHIHISLLPVGKMV